MNVLIVGGGIAGLSFAAFLEAEGISYEVVEKRPEHAQHGYLVSIWLNGRHILYKLGLGEKFDKAAAPICTYSMRTAEGRKIKDYDFTRFFSIGAVVFAIERSTLHEWLLSLVPSQKLEMGCTVVSMTEDASGVRVVFDDGEEKAYDLVIGADGMNSAVRSMLFHKEYRSYQDWRIWYTWIDARFEVPATISEYIDSKTLVSVFGTRDKATAWFFSKASHTEFDSEAGRKARLTKLFEKSAPHVSEIFKSLSDADFVPSDLVEVTLKSPVTRRCALIGDAAHGLGPFTGLGCSLALEDAYVLAAELTKGAASGSSIPDTLKRYAERRAPRIKAARRENAVLKMGAAVKNPVLRRAAIFLARFVPQSYVSAHYRTFLESEL